MHYTRNLLSYSLMEKYIHCTKSEFKGVRVIMRLVC